MRLLGGGDGIGTSPSLFGLGGSSHATALRSVEEEFVEGHEAYEHREYENDTRPVAALLLAHSKAMEKKRIGRAFKLKQDIENDGRSLDLLSYGSLVEHFGRTNEVGSALLLIKECIDTHGVAPEEKCLKNDTLLCRQENLADRVGLEKMVGEDPLEWMRHGI